jgi:hypothetical protein
MKLTVSSLSGFALLLGLAVSVNGFKGAPRSMIASRAISLRAGAVDYIPDPQPVLVLPHPVPSMKFKFMPVSYEGGLNAGYWTIFLRTS